MLTLCLRPAGRLYAMQTGMKLDSKSPECRKFLIKLMDQLEGVSPKHTTDILPVSCWRAPSTHAIFIHSRRSSSKSEQLPLCVLWRWRGPNSSLTGLHKEGRLLTRNQLIRLYRVVMMRRGGRRRWEE